MHTKFSRNVRKRTFGHVRLAKILISLRIREVWSETSLNAFWIAMDAKFIHVDNEDWSDCADVQAVLSLHLTHVRRYRAAQLVHRLVQMDTKFTGLSSWTQSSQACPARHKLHRFVQLDTKFTGHETINKGAIDTPSGEATLSKLFSPSHSFWNGVCSTMKEFASLGSSFVSFRVDRFIRGLCAEKLTVSHKRKLPAFLHIKPQWNSFKSQLCFTINIKYLKHLTK